MNASNIDARVQTVTPKLATQWLDANHTNRNVRDRVVNAYARDMQAGRWRVTGEAIKFAGDGRLIDGQHRLLAVIKTGRSIQMLIIRGLDNGVQEVLDSGASRTASDALRMRGESNYANLSAAARVALMFEEGRLRQAGTAKYTHSEILAFIEKNPELRAAVDTAASYRKQIDVPVSGLAVAIWHLAGIDPDDCALFFKSLAEKTDLSRGDAVLALLNRLTEVRRSGRQMDRADYLSLIFRAWNYWRASKPVYTLPVATRGVGYVDIPEPR